MRVWLRLLTLLLFCGVIALSVPVEAAQGGKAVEHRAQQVEATSDQVEQTAEIVSTIWTTIKFRFGSWFEIFAPSTPTTPQDGSTDPVKSQTDPRNNPRLFDVLMDNGGDIAI